MTKAYGWSPVLILFGVALLGSVARCLSSTGDSPWADALPSLYYVPIVAAGIMQGTRAAVALALASSLAHGLDSALGGEEPWGGPVFEALLYLGVGLTAARLSRARQGFAPVAAAPWQKSPDAAVEHVYQTARGEQEIPALSQIVAGLIHRFRTPVSSIEGAVSLLEDRQFPEERREEFVRIIQKESHHLDRALADIQEFTQPRSPRYQRVDFSELVDEVIRRAGPREHGPYILFRKEIEPGLVISCDSDQITKLLLNLVMNSIQATPSGGQIAIAARADGANAIITITDHGRGIPPDIVGRIFDPFFTTRENCLGLGLTVARQIAAAHCGNITVGGNSGSGTTVSILLPLKTDEC